MVYIQEKRFMYTVGKYAVLKIISPFEGEGFETKMTINFESETISRNYFISKNEVIVGLEAGNLQYMKMDIEEYT